jgi:hypothetical protein
MTKPLLGRRQQFGEIVCQPGGDGEAPVSRLVQEGGGGEVSIDDHVVGKARTAVTVAWRVTAGSRRSVK